MQRSALHMPPHCAALHSTAQQAHATVHWPAAGAHLRAARCMMCGGRSGHEECGRGANPFWPLAGCSFATPHPLQAFRAHGSTPKTRTCALHVFICWRTRCGVAWRAVGRCLEDLQSTTRYVSWSMHNKSHVRQAGTRALTRTRTRTCIGPAASDRLHRTGGSPFLLEVRLWSSASERRQPPPCHDHHAAYTEQQARRECIPAALQMGGGGRAGRGRSTHQTSDTESRCMCDHAAAACGWLAVQRGMRSALSQVGKPAAPAASGGSSSGDKAGSGGALAMLEVLESTLWNRYE